MVNDHEVYFIGDTGEGGHIYIGGGGALYSS